MSTMLFFESLPDEYVDAKGADWTFKPGDDVVPIIISKDYLALYNFGFAGSAGLPQMSESIMAGIPLRLVLTSDDGLRQKTLNARVTGFSNRLNTILVPRSFMEWSNAELGRGGAAAKPSRLVVDVSSPGDVAIKDYLSDHGLEVAGDKSGSSASFLLKLVVGIVLAVGIVITLLSLFILLLSISLLMEKNREKLHALLMLGCPLTEVSAPYERIIIFATFAAYLLAAACGIALRTSYISQLEALGLNASEWWIGLATGLSVALLVMVVNVLAVKNKVLDSWR